MRAIATGWACLRYSQGMGLDNPLHILLLLLVVLLVFGAKRLPEIGRSLGEGMRGFKDSLSATSHETLTPAPPPAAPVVTPVAPPEAVPVASAPAEPAPVAPSPAPVHEPAAPAAS
jgi:sec-independent protein translocase protein TatA